VRGRRREVLLAALRLATAVCTWESLVQLGNLADEDAVELLVGMVLSAAARPGRSVRTSTTGAPARS